MPFWNNFEGKPLDWIEDWDAFPGGDPEWAEWVRFVPTSAFADPVLEAARLVLLADLPSFPAASARIPRPAHVRLAQPRSRGAVPPARTSLGDWLLVQGVSPIADRGLMAFRSEVWSADGRQAASGSGQLLLRAVPPEGPSGPNRRRPALLMMKSVVNRHAFAFDEKTCRAGAPRLYDGWATPTVYFVADLRPRPGVVTAA